MDEEIKSNKCYVSGCSLRGDMSFSQTGSDKKMCMWHFKAHDPKDWDGISQRIDKNRALIDWRHHLLTNPIQYCNDRPLECHFAGKFSRVEGVTWAQHLDKIQSYLEKSIMRGVNMDTLELQEHFGNEAQKEVKQLTEKMRV